MQVDAQMLTFRELTNMIQKAMQILSKDDTVDAFPGIFIRHDLVRVGGSYLKGA